MSLAKSYRKDRFTDSPKALSVEYIACSSLILSERNARTHSQEQIAQLKRSILEWGWTNPILIDEERAVIAGHGRLAAAQSLGVAEVPTITLAGLSPAQKRALAIADNKLALNAGWDDDLLRLELGDLKLDGFDLSMIGFSDAELAGLLDSNPGLTDPDDAPEVQADAVSRLGDVWTLGRHRLVCGDCTTVEAVDAALTGVKPHLMVTDPPYGVDYDPDWRNQRIMVKGEQRGEHGSRAIGRPENDTRSDWSEAWSLFPGDVAYVWCAPGPLNCGVHNSLRDSGLDPRMQIVWAKSQFVIGRGHYHAQHENCWYAVRKSGSGHWNGDRKQSTVWQIDKPRKSETGHSTQKPVECMKRPIENNSSPGQAVYDPFMGSGTTCIAAEMSGRCAIGIEISPQYCDVTIRRWQNFVGQSATLNGRTFAAIEAERMEHADAA